MSVSPTSTSIPKMCTTPKTPQMTTVTPPVVANAANAVTPEEQLLKLKAANNNPNIATSPFGLIDPAVTEKKTLLGV